MANLMFEKFAIDKSVAKKILGGATYYIVCKDGDGNTLGSFTTSCDDESYDISDCKGIYPDTEQANRVEI